MLYTIYLATIALVQIGFSYWLSVAVFGCCAICLVNRQNIALLFTNFFFLRASAAIALPVAVAISPDSNFEDILVGCREGLFLFLITGSFYWQWKSIKSNGAADEPAAKVGIFAGSMLILVLIQTLALRSGQYFGIPRDWFVSNRNTIPTELDLANGFMRPNGTFGEPSYLGGVCLMLVFALSPSLINSRKARRAIATLAATALFSTSFSGVLSIASYLLRMTWKQVNPKWLVAGFSIVMSAVGVALLTIDNEISNRLAAVFSGNDVSAWARIFAPILLLPEVFSHSLAGYPKSVFTQLGYIPSIGVRADELGHNALLNLLVGYGVFGLPALFTLFYAAKGADRKLFVFWIACQNGALLAPDKFAIVSFGFMLHNSLSDYRKLSTNERTRRFPSYITNPHAQYACAPHEPPHTSSADGTTPAPDQRR